MHADKISRQSDFMLSAQPRAAERSQQQDYPQTVGRLSPLMRKSFGRASTAVLQAKQAQMQTKEQEQGSLSDALNSPGRPLPPQKRAHYENLLQTSLKHVTIHNMGSKESHILAKHNAIGVTDGQRILANSEDTLRHELTHVKQRNEGHVPTDNAKYAALERDADRGAESLGNGQPVQSFGSGVKSEPSAMQLKSAGALQTKCSKCEDEAKKQFSAKSSPGESSNSSGQGKQLDLETVESRFETLKSELGDKLWVGIEGSAYVVNCFFEEFPDIVSGTVQHGGGVASICALVNMAFPNAISAALCLKILALIAAGVSIYEIAECFKRYWDERPLGDVMPPY